MEKVVALTKTVIMIFIIFFLGCGGDDNDSNGTAPKITELRAYRIVNGVRVRTFEFWIGDEYTFEIDATDPDLDITHIDGEYYYPASATAPYYPDQGPTQLPSQSTRSTKYTLISPDTISGPTGNWKVEFWLIDSKGNESNEWVFFWETHE